MVLNEIAHHKQFYFMSDTYDWFVYINYVNDDNLLGANPKKKEYALFIFNDNDTLVYQQ